MKSLEKEIWVTNCAEQNEGHGNGEVILWKCDLLGFSGALTLRSNREPAVSGLRTEKLGKNLF